jgi:hypothetical protein
MNWKRNECKQSLAGGSGGDDEGLQGGTVDRLGRSILDRATRFSPKRLNLRLNASL